MLRSAFEAPGILRAFVAMLFARLPMGAEGLLLVLITNERTGSFAHGGLVVGAMALAHAVGSPTWGRIVDRRGPRFLGAVAAVNAAAMTTFALAPDSLPVAGAVALGAIAGIGMVPLTSVMRTVWNARLDVDRRHAALSIEGVTMELVYIAGPLLFITGVATWSLEAAALCCAAVTLSGTLLFISSPVIRAWVPEPEPEGGRVGALRGPGVRTLFLAMTLFAIHIPAMEIGVAASAEEHGTPGAVGLILGAWGLGSMVGGLIFGRLGMPERPVRRLAFLFAGMSIGVAGPALADGLLSLGILIACAGFFIAPSFAVAFGLLADVAPRGAITEANTWINTGFGVGIAAGGAVGGWVVEISNPQTGYLMGAAAVACAAMVVVAREATLRSGRYAVATASA